MCVFVFVFVFVNLNVCGLLLCWYSCLLCSGLFLLSSSGFASSVLRCSRSKLTIRNLPSPGSKLLYPKVVSGLHRVTNSSLRSSTARLLLLLRLFFLDKDPSGFLATMWNAEEGDEATSDIPSCELDGLQPSCEELWHCLLVT